MLPSYFVPELLPAGITAVIMLDVKKALFASNLGRAMAEKGWTQSELARRARQTQPFISQLINGRRVSISLEKALALAQALGISLDELATHKKRTSGAPDRARSAVEKWLLDPPPGSKAAAAKQFGVDLSLNAALLRLSDEERIGSLEAAARSIGGLTSAKKLV